MFVSCHPTVPRNSPDPSKSFFFILQKSPEKHRFLQFLTFILLTKFSSDFAHKIPFGIKKIKKKKMLLLKGILWTKLEENPVCKKKWLKIVKTVFFG